MRHKSGNRWEMEEQKSLWNERVLYRNVIIYRSVLFEACISYMYCSPRTVICLYLWGTFVYSWRCVYTQILEWLWLWFRPTFSHKYDFFLLTQNYSCSWIVDLTSMIFPPIGAILEVEANNVWILMESLPNPTNSLPCFDLNVLSQCHLVNTIKIEPKNVDYNDCTYSKLDLVQ